MQLVMQMEESILKFIGQQIAPGCSVGLDTNLVDVLDSTSIMELVVWVETTFQLSVEIDAVTPENFGGVRQIAAFVRAAQA